MKKRKAAAVLREAAKTIDLLGWVQNTYCIKGAGVCALGSMVHGPTYDYDYKKASVNMNCDAENVLRKFLGGQSVAKWNDAFGRTKDEVTKTMRQCAAALEHGWPEKPWNYVVPQ